MLFVFFAVNAGLSALNWMLYANNPNPASLGAGIFCGFMALFVLALAVTE